MNQPLGTSRPAEVLIAEDNDDDVELTRIAFESVGRTIHLRHVRNGEECMAFLRKQGGYAGVPTPDLVLLDLNMPRMDGREVLAQIAGDELLRCLPVVVLTTSSAKEDILGTYNLHCSSYIVKPVDFAQFERAIRILSDYWFSVVVLPTSLLGQARPPGA